MDEFEDHTLETDCESDSEDVLHSERTIKDPIHDQIPLPDFACKFIDTKQFQRLRHIKQLGTSYYVWPGAAHNRFEHCIGVMHLAGLMAQHLQQSQPELGISNRDVQCVMLAGLCHDLGHGPWSHVWDGLFIPVALPNLETKWTHEQGSELMFDYLVQDNNIGRPEEDYTFIKALIAGEHSRVPHEKAYLFDIISNKRNGMDVDKFDYLLRDSKMLGMMHNCIDASRIIRSSRVIDNQICYEVKDADSLFDVGELRYKLHKKIYHHKTAKAIEYMIIDALILAEPHMRIAQRVFQPEKYLHLTDEVMGWIEASEDPDLKPAQAILERIRKRDHYRRVDHGRFGWFEMDMCRQFITPEAITKEARRIIDAGDCAYPFTSSELPDDNVIVALSPLHYGMKDKNPLEGLKFYNRKLNPDHARAAGPGDYSTLAPEVCGEVLIQIFTKQRRFYGVVQNAYRRVVENAKTQPTTPVIPALDAALPTPSLTAPPHRVTPPSTPPAVLQPTNASPSPLTGGQSPHGLRALAPGGSPRAQKPLSTLKQSSFSEVPVAYDGTPAPRKPRSRFGRVASAGSDVFGGGRRANAGEVLPAASGVGRKRGSPEEEKEFEEEEGRLGKKRRTGA
ncbi:hypothetical protein HDZ31DRAFT_39918 [Schizophyllum fasciatum]